jgi:hypothetical protein
MLDIISLFYGYSRTNNDMFSASKPILKARNFLKNFALLLDYLKKALVLCAHFTLWKGIFLKLCTSFLLIKVF